MADGLQGPEAGWYPDPNRPSQLRYWDGSTWTDHFHEGDGRLPEIGQWFARSFDAIREHGIPALGLAFGTTVLTNLVLIVALKWAVTDLGVIDGELVGATTDLIVRFSVLALVVGLIQGLMWLVLNRFMQRAHQHAEPTMQEAFARALRRFPRYIGAMLLILVAMVVVIVIAAVLLVAAGGNDLVVALVVLALLVLGVWAFIKLQFVSTAVVAAPEHENPIRASAAVSKGRFWGVFGRILLLTIVVSIVSNIVDAVFGGLTTTIDPDLAATAVDGDDFFVRDFLPTTAQLIPWVLLSGITGALSGIYTTSAYVKLYLDSGAPAEL